MAIIAKGRVDKKLFLLVLLLMVQTAQLVAENEGDGLYDKNFQILEEEIGSIILGIIVIKKQMKQEKVKKVLNILLFYLF